MQPVCHGSACLLRPHDTHRRAAHTGRADGNSCATPTASITSGYGGLPKSQEGRRARARGTVVARSSLAAASTWRSWPREYAAGRAASDFLRSFAMARSRTALLLVDFMNPLDFDGGDALARHAVRAARCTAALKARLARGRVPAVYCNDNFGRWESE
jgi:hypothetical protein